MICALVSCHCGSFCVPWEGECPGGPAETPSAAISSLGMTGETSDKWPQNFLIKGELQIVPVFVPEKGRDVFELVFNQPFSPLCTFWPS